MATTAGKRKVVMTVKNPKGGTVRRAYWVGSAHTAAGAKQLPQPKPPTVRPERRQPMGRVKKAAIVFGANLAGKAIGAGVGYALAGHPVGATIGAAAGGYLGTLAGHKVVASRYGATRADKARYQVAKAAGLHQGLSMSSGALLGHGVKLALHAAGVGTVGTIAGGLVGSVIGSSLSEAATKGHLQASQRLAARYGSHESVVSAHARQTMGGLIAGGRKYKASTIVLTPKKPGGRHG